ncbi:Hypothetical predicted protein [Podarcis lilfordi]|uniref:Uncharacterized protein n=1 Tax=Podarcis lilfordi TaxID=74358 RepID=A0AA35PG30_9SAUR|nr:Hypothetical predicted protein [Podarcis lilfordi]
MPASTCRNFCSKRILPPLPVYPIDCYFRSPYAYPGNNLLAYELIARKVDRCRQRDSLCMQKPSVNYYFHTNCTDFADFC